MLWLVQSLRQLFHKGIRFFVVQRAEASRGIGNLGNKDAVFLTPPGPLVDRQVGALASVLISVVLERIVLDDLHIDTNGLPIAGDNVHGLLLIRTPGKFGKVGRGLETVRVPRLSQQFFGSIRVIRGRLFRPFLTPAIGAVVIDGLIRNKETIAGLEDGLFVNGERQGFTDFRIERRVIPPLRRIGLAFLESHLKIKGDLHLAVGTQGLRPQGAFLGVDATLPVFGAWQVFGDGVRQDRRHIGLLAAQQRIACRAIRNLQPFHSLVLWFAPVGIITPKLLPAFEQHPVTRFVLFDFVGATADRIFDVFGVADLQEILRRPVPPEMVVMTANNGHNARVRTFRFDEQMVVATHLKCVERRFDFGRIQGTLEPFDEPHGAFQAFLEHSGIGLFAILTGRFGV